MEKQFTISGFADEIDENVEKQFTHLNKLGIRYFEPRGIDGKNIADLDDEEVVALKKKMDNYGIRVSSVGSPLGKISITEDFVPHMEKLKRVIRTAKMLDTQYIRVFSFFMPEREDYENYKDEVFRRMEEMVRVAEEEGVILLHENEKNIYGDIAERCLKLVKTINSPALRCVFDPANFIQCGQAVYPEAYEMLRPYIAYMHIKDAQTNGSVVPAGYGIGRLEQIIRSLKESGYHGFLSLEPHLGSFAGLKNLEIGDEMLDLERSTPDKFTIAYQALLRILERVEK